MQRSAVANCLAAPMPIFERREIGELLHPDKIEPRKIGLRVNGPDGNGLDVANAVDSPWPLMAADEIPNARLATKMVGDWREARAKEQEALRAQIEQAEVGKAEEARQKGREHH